MKGKFIAEFAGFKKIGKSKGWALILSNIKDEGNMPVAKEGTVSFSKGFKNLGDMKKGDVFEFEAEVKKLAFEYPKNVKMFERKFDLNEKEPLENFFDINKE